MRAGTLADRATTPARARRPDSQSNLSRVALVILFAWSFAAATILPIASEVPLAVVIRQSGSWIVPVAVATVGNVLGACTTYWLARAASAAAPRPSTRVREIAARLAAYGPPVLLLSWVPLVGDVLVALAGAAAVPFTTFTAWVTLGKLGRYGVVAALVGSTP